GRPITNPASASNRFSVESMNQPGMIVSINGQLTPVEAARIDPRDRAFTLGDGLYETIRVRDGRLMRIDRHFARLDEGLRLLEIRLKLDENALTGAMRAV